MGPLGLDPVRRWARSENHDPTQILTKLPLDYIIFVHSQCLKISR